jgi:hypothetical protein
MNSIASQSLNHVFFSFLFYLVFFILYGQKLYAQVSSNKTEIFIIGTVHFGNKKIRHNSLYNILEKYKPDVILWEDEEDFKTVFGLFTAYRLKIARPPIEQLALQKFRRKNKNVPILGFDIDLKPRNEYIKRTIKIDDRFHQNMYETKMERDDSLIYDNYLKKRVEYISKVMSGTLTYINQPEVFNLQRDIQEMEDQNLSIAEKYLKDITVVNEYKKETTFWSERNDFMVNQIISVAYKQKGKRIIVITGISHKYYLLDKLNRFSTTDYLFRDFTDWSY